VDLMVGRVAQQARAQGIELEITQEVREMLAREGFDPQFGARPLRRAVQRLIEDPLAEEILLGRFSEGDTVLASLDEDGRLVFLKKETSEAENPPEPAGVG